MASSISDSDDGDVRDPPRGRKRSRNVMEWKKHSVKLHHDVGQAYTSRFTGKKVAARKVGAPCNDGCFDKLTMPVVESLFEGFYGLADYDKQTAYIQSLVKTKPVKRRRVVVGEDAPRKSQIYEYTVVYNNVVSKVCKRGFLSIFAISDKRVITAMKKLTVTGTPISDKRGKHTPSNKKHERVHELIKEHVDSVPKVASHYTRAKSPDRKYLSTELNMAKLYELYREWMNDKYPEEEKVKESFYRNTVNKKFNIGFAPVKTDTCNTCDLMTNQINARKLDNALQDEIETYEKLLSEHQAIAREGQDLITNFRGGPFDNDDTLALCFDLQQTLPTPKVTHGAAYYKRKLWTLNFCITNMRTNTSTMFVWDEVTGKRGSVEIASCLQKYLDLHHEEAEQTTLFLLSDNCAGQNKNLNVSLMLLRLIHAKKFFNIYHHYLVPGHSYMPCDRHFGNIEKKLRMHAVIETKYDYIRLIKDATHKGFEVVEMDREDFLDFDVLQRHVTKRTPTGTLFSESRIIKYQIRYAEGYQVKDTYSSDNPYKKVRMMKGRQPYKRQAFNLSTVPLPPKYDGPVRIKPVKLKELRELLPFVTTGARTSYFDAIVAGQEALQHQGRGAAADSDTDVEDENEEEDNLIEYDDE